EAQGREGLQVAIVPDALRAFAEIDLAFLVYDEGIVLLVQDLDIEGVGILRVPFQRIRRHQSPDQLLLVGLDEYAGPMSGRLASAHGVVPQMATFCPSVAPYPNIGTRFAST